MRFFKKNVESNTAEMAEEILKEDPETGSQSSRRREEDEIARKAGEIYADAYLAPPGVEEPRRKYREIYDQFQLLKAKDETEARILNEEFDRLTKNLSGKKGKDLEVDQQKLEEFKEKLNRRVEEIETKVA